MYLYDDYFLVDSNGLNECTDGYWEDPSLKYSNKFDDIFKTGWSVLYNDYTFSIFHIWRFRDNDQMIANKYNVSSTSYGQLESCYFWTISAFNDGVAWEVLD